MSYYNLQIRGLSHQRADRSNTGEGKRVNVKYKWQKSCYFTLFFLTSVCDTYGLINSV